MPVCKPAEQHTKAAKLIAKGMSIKEALLEAGFSKATANKGRYALEQSRPLRMAVRREMGHEYKEFVRIGRTVNPDEQRDFVRGRLISNALKGEDEAYQSLKMLGQESTVNMFTPDVQLGQIVILPPRALAEFTDPEQHKTINADNSSKALPVEG